MFYLAILPSLIVSYALLLAHFISSPPHPSIEKKVFFLFFNNSSRSGKEIELGEKSLTKTLFSRAFK